MNTAPFHADLAEGPEDVTCVWQDATDGVQLRLAYWPGNPARGTVLLFPGRTEHIEKYGRIAREVNAAGFALITLDWRGQGMSARLLEDRSVGHVARFLDYQQDVNELTRLAQKAELPKPWYLIGHSMGGCIGLRALIDGLDVQRAVFSAPLWGFELPAAKRLLALVLPPVARVMQTTNRIAPGATLVNYTSETAFEDNSLTGDPETYAWLKKHAEATPDFALAGPSVQWVSEAIIEFDALAKLPRPDLPVRTYLGTKETIVSSDAIHQMHANWPSGELHVVDGAKHEFMMETDAIRRQFMDGALGFFHEQSTA